MKAEQSWQKIDIVPSLSLLLISCYFIWVRWCQMDSLIAGDACRWIFEIARAAQGELFYRDFAWQYAPFSISLFSIFLKIFGTSFQTVQILLDILGLLVVFLTWRIALRVLHPGIAFAVALGFVCVGATSESEFALFSLKIYTPAVLTGTIGTLLFAGEMIDYWQDGSLTNRRLILLSIGSFIGLTSKPEYILAIIAGLSVMMVLDLKRHFSNSATLQWCRHYLKLISACVLPAIMAYLLLGYFTGFSNLITAISGYGFMAVCCPWWPTGIGFYGAMAALGEAIAIATILSLVRGKDFYRVYRLRYVLLWLIAITGMVILYSYLPYATGNFAGAASRVQGLNKYWQQILYLGSSNGALLPVCWASIFLWVYLAISIISNWTVKERLSDNQSFIFPLLTLPVAMSIRGLFYSNFSVLPTLPSAAYAFWFILGGHLLARFLHMPDRLKLDVKHIQIVPMVLWITMGIFIGYGATRLIVGKDRGQYRLLETVRGRVYLKDYQPSASCYNYVIAHSAPDSLIVEIPYGGGLAFAAQRTSPIYSTQFAFLAVPDPYLNLDLARLKAAPPALVIAFDDDRLGTVYGVNSKCRCTFPRLVWMSETTPFDINKTYPVVDYIKANYHKEFQIDKYVILSP